jgi:hypothetical protein
VAVRAPTHAFTVDEPPALGGSGSAPNPVEYALASLGSCQAITYRFWAENLGISFDKLTVTVEGDLDIRNFLGFDDSVRPGFSAVRVQIGITGQAPGALPATRRGGGRTLPGTGPVPQPRPRRPHHHKPLTWQPHPAGLAACTYHLQHT